MSSIRSVHPSELDVMASIDEDASALFVAHGITLNVSPEHELVLAERERWRRAAQLGRAFLAVDAEGASLGFTALDVVDGEPYLDQLAVRVSAMRRGVGASLLAHASAWAKAEGAAALWLTTYSHLPFNRPYYERHGYVVVPELQCGPGILHHLAEQRRLLPAPRQRVAMRRML